MLKTLIPLMTLALLWGPAATAANPSDPMPDATTTTMATAGTPQAEPTAVVLDHACPCLHDNDCEDAMRIAEEAAPVKLTDLNPKWITASGREGLGVTFDCPCNACRAAPPVLSRTDYAVGASIQEIASRGRVSVFFDTPTDGRPQLADVKTWHREGSTFDDLTLSPSIVFSFGGAPQGVVEHWHGFVRAGVVTS